MADCYLQPKGLFRVTGVPVGVKICLLVVRLSETVQSEAVRADSRAGLQG